MVGAPNNRRAANAARLPCKYCMRLHELAKSINWMTPNFDYEYQEVEAQPALKTIFPDKQRWEAIAKTGQASKLTRAQLQRLENHDPDLMGLDDDKVERAKQAFNSGTVELPIVLRDGDFMYLMAGNTRTAFARKFGYPVHAWVIDIPDLEEYL